MPQQQHRRRIAMTPAEVDAFLDVERTCRVASVGADGAPHNTPLWFVWDGTALWLYSLTRSKRWSDLERDPRVSVVVDAGREYQELRGVELRGEVRVVGEVPRSDRPHEQLDDIERSFARKHFGVDAFVPDGRHAWLRLEPHTRLSWDFGKLPIG